MSPAKATRPGFRQSLATDETNGNETASIHLFHPIYHSFTNLIGNKVDIERILPADLDELDEEELIDTFSEPPAWAERFAPLGVQLGETIIRAKNAPELSMKVYRHMFEMFHGIGRFIESTVSQNQETTVRYPFMSLSVDPESMHQLIQSDYESGEMSYSTLMKLFSQGTLAPSLTTPFSIMLTQTKNEAELRFLVRSAMIFYSRILKIYAAFLKKQCETGLMVVPFWLPEGGYTESILNVIEEEFHQLCKSEKLGRGHLVFLFDNHQAEFNENDVLMKSWNQIPREDRSNGRSRKKDDTLHEGVKNISVVFRDRNFSDWVTHSNPSVKKLLDRTIAKVDSDINQLNVHYGWAHFEELDAVTFTPRAIMNFQQKLIKLTELGYLPLSPDFYVRGKLRGEFGCTPIEPQEVNMQDKSVGAGWDLENSLCHARWSGLQNSCPNGGTAEPKLATRPFQKPGPEGKITVNSNPCWKLAWNKILDKCYDVVVGDLENCTGGMIEVLTGITGHNSKEKQFACAQDFLANYTYVYWREHFIQHDLAEADINIEELVHRHLRAGVKKSATQEQIALASGAAQAIFFLMEARRSTGAAWENMDQRAFYQNVVMLNLALINCMYVYHWMGDKKSVKDIFNLLKTELIEFEDAYDRYDLGSQGVSKNAWKTALKSEINDSKFNVVKRASLRTAARHLRPLGYIKEFTRQDANLSTNVGHIWSAESCRENFCYENMGFCGVQED